MRSPTKSFLKGVKSLKGSFQSGDVLQQSEKRPAVCIEPAQSEILAVGKESALEIEQSSKKTAAQQKEVTTDLENKSVCIPQSEASPMVHRSALEVIQQYTDEFRSPPGG